MTISILYYTDNILEESFAARVQKELLKAAGGKKIITVSQKPIDFGDSICLGDIGRSHHSLFRQILVGAKAATTENVALVEHDCMYTPEHFNWIPPDSKRFFYNVNHWFVQWGGKHSGEYSYGRRKVLSNLICNRELLIRALEEKVKMIELGAIIRKGQVGACEPGVCDDRVAFVELKEQLLEQEYLKACKENPNHKDVGKETFSAKSFKTVLPNLDIRHGKNFSGGRHGGQTTYDLPYWGNFNEYMGGI